MTSALDIITGGAKLLGLVFKSEALAADEAADGLITLNDMLDTWSNDNLATFAYTLESFPLTSSVSYTIGVGGNFNTARPINIVDAVIRSGSIDYPLTVITQEEYQTQIANKTIASTIPQYLTYDNGYPLGIIKMYPVASGGTLYLQSNKPLSNLSGLSTVVDLPPGWKRALKYNWALSAAGEYGIEPSASVVQVAKQSLGAIRRSTAVNNAMPLLPSVTNTSNIYTGYWQ